MEQNGYKKCDKCGKKVLNGKYVKLSVMDGEDIIEEITIFLCEECYKKQYG